MNKEQLEKEIENIRQGLVSLEHKLALAKFPSEGETYYYLNSMGGISCGSFGKYAEQDRLRLELGNFYRTRNEARLMATELKRFYNLRRVPETV